MPSGPIFGLESSLSLRNHLCGSTRIIKVPIILAKKMQGDYRHV
ncbi:hypothetical protein C5167_003793 [Papaver somniferum]|uniref:Uncharacterized protein n=1 Tax=Papaver somniferum TaxID=3469 RepID=A0A4Y7L5W2_PAPSO|nr:hypothetical protein C5167_003793 [Papaver somniferum]